MNMDERLLRYYLELKSPDAGKWNSSPECLYTEFVTRDYIRRSFELTEGIQVCNVGIGTGDWDDYLGYWLNGKGNLTSIDIDPGICEIFEYRQRREGHPNPSNVLCNSIFDSELPVEKFDIVTLIGSAVNETGDFNRCLDSCFRLLKRDGYLMFMGNVKQVPFERLETYISHSTHRILQNDLFDSFPKYPFYICTIKK